MEKTRKKALALRQCIAALAIMLCLPSTSRAQITELTSDGSKAKVHFYLRFTEQHQIRKPMLAYSINGATYATSDYNDVAVGSNTFFEFIVEAPYDNTNKRLQYPIEIAREGISWRDGVLSFLKYNANPAKFYGDAFIYVEEYRGLIEAARVDYAKIYQDMEESVMYAYNPTTGLSTLINEHQTIPYGNGLIKCENGLVTWEVNTQDFQHVGNKSGAVPGPSSAEITLVRKSAYKSWQYTLNGTTYGNDLNHTFVGSDADLKGDDVFHACAKSRSGKDNAATLFNTLRVAEEQSWPTGCTATRSCAVQGDPSSTTDIGLVGHFRLTLKPRVKKWKAESWIEMVNNHADGWATFCTPYDVRVPEGLLVLAIDGMVPNETNRLNMVSMADHPNIPANTGVMVKGIGKFEFQGTPDDDETIADDRTAYAGSGNKMQYVPLTGENNINSLPYSCSSGTHYVLTVGGETLTKEIDGVMVSETIEVPKFVKAIPNTALGDGWDDTTTAGHIQPFKSYLCISGVSGARELDVNWNGEANGIADVPVATTQSKAIYDLSGRRYSDKGQLAPGLYIVNGHKQLIK